MKHHNEFSHVCIKYISTVVKICFTFQTVPDMIWYDRLGCLYAIPTLPFPGTLLLATSVPPSLGAGIWSHGRGCGNSPLGLDAPGLGYSLAVGAPSPRPRSSGAGRHFTVNSCWVCLGRFFLSGLEALLPVWTESGHCLEQKCANVSQSVVNSKNALA